ncbi:MAG: FkbM family methyltransferase [Acetobacteraceae bacterium]
MGLPMSGYAGEAAKPASIAARALRGLKRRLLTRPFVACRTVGDHWVNIHHRGTRADLGVIRQCFQEQQLEIPQLRPHYRERANAFYRRIVAAGRTPLILDCGANIGVTALWFQARYPDAHIVAIEPASDNFALLSRNCVGPTWDLRQAAIGNQEGSAHLTDPGEGEWGYRTTEFVGGYEVAVVTVAGVLAGKAAKNYAPFLLKVDIEGAEKTLFDESAEVLDWFPVLVVEPHDWLSPGSGIASGFFRFHAETKRDYVHKGEHVFSISYRRMLE